MPNEDVPEPLGIQALCHEFSVFGLNKSSSKAKELDEKSNNKETTADEAIKELEECLDAEYKSFGSLRHREFTIMHSLTKELFQGGASEDSEVFDLGNWYALQQPSEGLQDTYKELRELDVNDTKRYLQLSCQVFIIHWELNVNAIYDFFTRNGKDTLDEEEIKNQLNQYFSVWKVDKNGDPDLLHIKNAIDNKSTEFIGDNALTFIDPINGEEVYRDSFNVNNFVSLCNGLDMKIRLVSLMGHYFLVLRELRKK